MLGTINLNDTPLPEDDDDEENFEQNVKEHIEPPKHIQRPAPIVHEERSVDILRREREERRQKMKRERPDEKPMYGSHPLPNMNEEPFEPRNHRPFNRSKLPQGWLDCPPCGSEIGLLIPSKVPLGESFNDSVLPGRRYSSRQVMRQQRNLGRKIGLVIDLTNTTRYYSVSEWKNEGVKHFKICCKGRDSVPDNESVNQFYFEVVQFIARQKQEKKYILVHCTHGHNRTGYMIVHYLMRTSGISVTQAIKLFADARPPGIYKRDYIDALYEFYHERKPETVVYPATPEWKRPDLNGEAILDDDDEDDGGSPLSPANKNCEMDVAKMTNDDVLGDSIPKEQEEIFRQFCYQTLKMGVGVRGCSQFPGSHPVSLSRDNLQLLRQKYYYATWKADGTRYMMLITMDGCYLVDRNFNFRRVQMRFPLKPINEALAEKTHNFTLLDGEMIIDTLPDSQKQERRYLIYDMMSINQVSVKELPFYERWKMIEKEVIEPRNFERSRNHYYRYDLEPFRVRRKDFWPLSTVTKLLKEFIPRLSHDADGLVFQGWDDPYVTRTHDSLLKWKYASMNSVDFLFEVNDDRQLLFLNERGKKKLMEGNRVVFNDGSEPASYSGKIVECSWDSEAGIWVCMRIRTDKSAPNDFNTYQKVMQSIRDNITEDILLSEIAETIELPMYADRIQKERNKLSHQHSMSSRRIGR